MDTLAKYSPSTALTMTISWLITAAIFLAAWAAGMEDNPLLVLPGLAYGLSSLVGTLLFIRRQMAGAAELAEEQGRGAHRPSNAERRARRGSRKRRNRRTD